MSLNQHIRSYLQNHQLTFDERAEPASHSPPPSSVRALHSPSSDSSHSQSLDFLKRSEFWQRPPIKESRSCEVTKSLSRRFPFSKCTDPQLRETKNSKTSSLELAVKTYLRSWHRRAERNLLYKKGSMSVQDTQDTNGDVTSELTLVSSESSSLPSSIMKKAVGEKGKSQLITAVYQCFSQFFEKIARLPADALHDELMVYTLNFITNYFLQSYSASNTKQLCGEILQDLRSDSSSDTLLELVEEVEYRHEAQGLEDFKDLCISKVSEDGASKTDNVCNPNLYSSFHKIWRLCPATYQEYSLDMIFSACEQEWSDYTRWNDSWQGHFDEEFEDNAIKMNVLRFHYYYRWELQNERDPDHMSDEEELDWLTSLLCRAVERVAATLDEEKSPEAGSRKKCLRFHDDVRI